MDFIPSPQYFFNIFLYLIGFVYGCGCGHATAHMRRLEDQDVNPKEAVRPGDKLLYPFSHLASLQKVSENKGQPESLYSNDRSINDQDNFVD